MTAECLKDNNYQWGAETAKYQESKKHLGWEGNCRNTRITHKDVKTAEIFFNPITQKYTDSTIQDKIKSEEKRILPAKISNFYDKSLRYEQTFDIINLKDKLKMFKDHPDYPKERQDFGNKIVKDMSKIDYNILSNLKLKEHHYEKPEKRPSKQSTTPKVKPKMKQAWAFKDFDIITNKYVDNHQLKATTEEQAFKLESASKYWKTHEFDSIVGKFYNKTTEEAFQKQQKDKEATWGKDKVLKLPKKVQEQGLLYNPVNQHVLDQDRLTSYLNKEGSKKKRYEKRREVEAYYFNKSIEEDDKRDLRKKNKKCYDFYREEDNRGFNIVNQEKNFSKYKSSLKLKDHTEGWSKVVDSTGANTTLETKKLYKEAYDYSDNENHLHNFKEMRASKYFHIMLIETLNKLPEIEKDPNFAQTNRRAKNPSDDARTKNVTTAPARMMLKKDWFSSSQKEYKVKVGTNALKSDEKKYFLQPLAN